jgi:hypothetical protein
VTRLPALALAATALLAGCGGDDEKSDAPATTASTTTTAASEANTFESSDIGFTFTYPKEWQETEEGGKVLGAVSPVPNDPQNGVKVRKTSDQELTFASYSGQISSQFEDQLGVKVDVRDETHGDIDMGVMEWTSSLTYKDLGQEVTTEIHSTSYFFTASGKTWQLECLSTEEQRADIDAGCSLVIESIEPS